ncbi:MAG TPA: hypothetical protein PLS67_02670 [Accumulibacter sp.]|jgi:hypothetical protein|nr:hypothetical protein [Accumulibacter sp.]HQC79411.1 hypothetical protein [Accumulibacter sp.]
MTTARPSGRRTLLLVTVLLALPFAIAFGLYWFEWRPARLGNHGQLIEPPRPLPETGLRHRDGRPLPTEELRHKWTLVLVNGGSCESVCQDDLQKIRQVQVALNKEMMRLRRLLLATGTGALDADPALADIQRQFPDLLIAAPAENAAGAAMRGRFDGGAYRFYVVDPLGNVMLRYPDKPDMRGMLKDLERLLKYSWVG